MWSTQGCPTNLLCKVAAAYVRGEVCLEVWHSCWKHFSQVQVEVMVLDYATVVMFTTCCLRIICSPTKHVCVLPFLRQLWSKSRKIQVCSRDTVKPQVLIPGINSQVKANILPLNDILHSKDPTTRTLYNHKAPVTWLQTKSVMHCVSQ